MTRNLKVLGLALVAACAMCAALASAAQASEKAVHATCESYPCVITGEAINHPEIGVVHRFIVGGKTITCKFTKFDATIPDAEHNSVITATPTYKECTAAPGGLPVTVTMNGCDYEIHGGETDGAHHFVGVTIDLVCPTAAVVEVHIYASAAKHTELKSQCTVTVPPFKGKDVTSTNTITNTTETPWDVDLVTHVENIPVQVHPEGLICGKTDQKATYTGTTTLKAFKDKKEDHVIGPHEKEYTHEGQIGLTISDIL